MIELILLVVFPALMIYAAASDIVAMKISNGISLALVAGFAVLSIGIGLPLHELGMHVAAGALVLAVGVGLFALRQIGGGDAKLAAAVALWFGFGSLMDYLMVTALIGGGLTVFIIGMRMVTPPAFVLNWTWFARLHDKRVGVPYGVALAAAALLVYPQSAVFHVAIAG